MSLFNASLCVLIIIGAVVGNKYSIDTQRLEIEWFDKNAFEICEAKTYKYNRTTSAISFFVLVNYDVTSIKLDYVAFLKSGPVYVRTAIQSTVDFCDLIKSDDFGLHKLTTQGNFTECPITTRAIGIKDFRLDSNKFPSYLPPGNFKLKLTFFVNERKATIINAFIQIKY